jgi:2'-5' RNA ligase
MGFPAHIYKEKFKPHITIGRIKNRAINPEQAKVLSADSQDLSFGKFICSEIKLKSSVLSEKGPEYKDVFVKKLSS